MQNGQKILETGKTIGRLLLKCPDCGKRFDDKLRCSRCFREIRRSNGYYDLLPEKLAANKINEDAIFAPGGSELDRFGQKPWRKLIGRLEIERFDNEIIPILPVGVFLELAGESC